MEKRTLSRLKEKEWEDRKDLILDAAVKLFATKPYDKVSLQEIANEAGLAKSSIYTYFSTQEALFVEAGMRDANSLFLEWEAILNKKDKSCLGKMINTWIDFFISHESFYRMTAQYMLYGKMSLEASDKLNPITRRMLDNLELAIRRLDYKGDSRLLAHTLFSALSGILMAYRKYPGRSVEEIRKHMKRIGNNIREMMEVFIRDSRI